MGIVNKYTNAVCHSGIIRLNPISVLPSSDRKAGRFCGARLSGIQEFGSMRGAGDAVLSGIGSGKAACRSQDHNAGAAGEGIVSDA